MSDLLITGGHPLRGRVQPQGSKNVFLHLYAASLLASEPVTLAGVPDITDTAVCRAIATSLGLECEITGGAMLLGPHGLEASAIPWDLGRQIRPTACLGAALLARTGRAWFATPGGDSFTLRLIDRHIAVMRAAGAAIETTKGSITAQLSGNRARGFAVSVDTPYGPSLGATVTALIMAVTAEGASRITEASTEPEVTHTLCFLRRLGARIRWSDDRTIEVQGVPSLDGGKYTVPPDRMVAGTLAIAAALTDGCVTLGALKTDDLPSGLIEASSAAGIDFTETQDGLCARRGELCPIVAETRPHPGLPTDIQPQLTTLLTQAPGTSHIMETVYTARETHLPGLNAMGAYIQAEGRRLRITGPNSLRAANVRGGDIRAAAALLLAGLAAEGVTRLGGTRHLRRGYANLLPLLSGLGAHVEEDT